MGKYGMQWEIMVFYEKFITYTIYSIATLKDDYI